MGQIEHLLTEAVHDSGQPEGNLINIAEGIDLAQICVIQSKNLGGVSTTPDRSTRQENDQLDDPGPHDFDAATAGEKDMAQDLVEDLPRPSLVTGFDPFQQLFFLGHRIIEQCRVNIGVVFQKTDLLPEFRL